MDIRQQKNENLSDIQESLKVLLNVNNEEVFEVMRWGDLDTTDLRYNWGEIIWPILNDLNKANLTLLDLSPLHNLRNHLAEITTFIGKFKDFSTTKIENSREQLNAYNKQFAQKARELWNLWAQWGTFLKVQEINIETLDQKLHQVGEDGKKRIAEILEDLENEKKKVQTAKTEAEKILEGIKADTGEIQVQHFSTQFETEANSFDKSAVKWLKATGVLGGISLILAVALFFGWLPEKEYPLEIVKAYPLLPILHGISSKFIMLGILITATLWCAKQYNIRENLAKQNKHRANSLQTFRSFTNAANTPEVRDQVLKEATKAIFRPLPTGHIRENAIGEPNSFSIVELTKTVTDQLTPKD